MNTNAARAARIAFLEFLRTWLRATIPSSTGMRIADGRVFVKADGRELEAGPLSEYLALARSVGAL